MNTTRTNLLLRLRDPGDSKAWEEFYEYYSGLIRSYALARGMNDADAEDITSECMRLLVRKMPKFDYDKNKGKFRGWLKRIVDGKVTDLMRKRRMPRADTEEVRQMPETDPNPEELWEQKCQQALLYQCLGILKEQVPEHQFEAFRLYALEECPADQVAENLGLTANHVYVIKNRLLEHLQRIMKEQSDEES